MPPQFTTVTASGLVKMYGTTRALVGVDASFPAGVVTVIQGHNGSGKSTLIQILAQLARPTRGQVRYGKFTRRKARRFIGLVAHAALLYPDLSARENLQLFAELHGLDHKAADAAVERFELKFIADRPVRTYSRGQLQRASLARALLSAPQLLLLDEPSAGLDHEGVDRLVSVVAEEKARGAIVVLVTHDSGFAERVGDRRLLLRRGRVVDGGDAEGPFRSDAGKAS